MNINIFLTHLIIICLFSFQTTQANTKEQEHVSLNFDIIDVRYVLKKLAEHHHKNIIIAPDINEKTSLHVSELPWQTAIQAIAQAHQLEIKLHDNIWIINKAQLKTLSNPPLLPTTSNLYSLPIRHIDFDDLEDVLVQAKNQNLIHSEFILNKHTNQIFFYTAEQEFNKISKLIEKIDQPFHQIEIAARIVLVNQDATKNLGVRLGFTGMNMPIFISNSLEQNHQAIEHIQSPYKAKSSLPLTNINAGIDSALGQIAFSISDLTASNILDLELSALEHSGKGEVISRPRLVTSDQTEAIIESGEEIPFQSRNTKEGQIVYSTAFKKAVLALKVLPRIMQNNQIKLRLIVMQNTRGILTESGPAINTQKIETEVIVENGKTIVLGGIYSKNKQNQASSVPFLGALPLIGFLFKRTNLIDKKRELLIFVTPKIIDEQTNVTL